MINSNRKLKISISLSIDKSQVTPLRPDVLTTKPLTHLFIHSLLPHNRLKQVLVMPGRQCQLLSQRITFEGCHFREETVYPLPLRLLFSMTLNQNTMIMTTVSKQRWQTHLFAQLQLEGKLLFRRSFTFQSRERHLFIFEMVFNCYVVFLILSNQFIVIYCQQLNLLLQGLDFLRVTFDSIQKTFFFGGQSVPFFHLLALSGLTTDVLFECLDLFSQIFNGWEYYLQLFISFGGKIVLQLLLEFPYSVIALQVEDSRVLILFGTYGLCFVHSSRSFFHDIITQKSIQILVITVIRSLQSTMTQLSPISNLALARFRSLLLAIDQKVAQGKVFVCETVPEIARSIAYLFVIFKDLSTFIPQKVVKTIFSIVVLSFLYRWYRKNKAKNRKKSGDKLTHKYEKSRQHEQHIHKSLDQLGPEFEVKKSLGQTGPEQPHQEQDSCCQDLTHQLHQTRDFRDIVFFELMRGYSQYAEEGDKSIQ